MINTAQESSGRASPQETPPAQPAARLLAGDVEKAREAEARARQASEMALEAAVRARESLLTSAQTTRELALDARRKLRGARIAAAEAKKQARLTGRIMAQARESGVLVGGPALMSAAEKTEERAPLNAPARQDKAGAPLAPAPAPAPAAAGAPKIPGGDMFQGKMNIFVQNSSAGQVNSLAEALCSAQDLKVMVSGSVEQGTKIIVLAEQPVPLIDILGRIPQVNEVTQFGPGQIQLSLKT